MFLSFEEFGIELVDSRSTGIVLRMGHEKSTEISTNGVHGGHGAGDVIRSAKPAKYYWWWCWWISITPTHTYTARWLLRSVRYKYKSV